MRTNIPHSIAERCLTATTLLLSLGLAATAGTEESARQLNPPPEGFTALFNGKDLTGWRLDARGKQVWSIEDGVLRGNGQGHSDLYTKKEFRDFVLTVDYRMPEPSDSGIYFRRLRPEMGLFGQREQFNLNAGGGGWMGNLLSFHFLPEGMQLKEQERPPVRPINPEVGVWHTIKLTVIGRSVTAEYDGEVILDRFVYPERLLSMKPGPIGLQKHAVVEMDGKTSNMPVEFRNIFIKEIKPSRLNVPPEGFTTLFNGKNFNGWRLSPAVQDAWSIEGGILTSHKTIKDWGADLRTVKKYRDYVLLVDYRIPRISDSGIYIRGLMPGIGIFDRDRWEQFNLRSRGSTGTLESFRFQPPDRRVEPPRFRPFDPEVGVWHTVKLTLIGKTLSAEYDGETIIDQYEYADGILSMEPSVIRLQKHPPSEIGGEMSDCPIEFRNIFIKEIKPTGFPKEIKRPELNVPPRGFTALFSGTDFTGWQATPEVKEAWTIEDGVLKAHHQVEDWGADLTTERKYRDFVLLVDFKFPTISDSGIWFRGIPGIMGGMEQFNLMSVYGTGNLDSLDHLPKDVQLSFRDAAYPPFFYCQPAYYSLKDPPVRYTDPQVGVWHTVKLTLIGSTLSAEFDGHVIHDRLEYPEGTISMEPAPIRLQKHVPQTIAGNLYKECPIEFRNIFIKEIGPGESSEPGEPRESNVPLAKLLARIDAGELPEGYVPAKHQEYVDRRWLELSPEQSARVNRLWKEKQAMDPDIPNRGFSFVKILAYVADEEGRVEQPAPAANPEPQTSALPIPHPVNQWKWSAETGDEATGRKAIPIELPDGPAIYVVPFGVAEGETPPVVLLPGSRLKVRGRIATAEPMHCGTTIQHPNGDFAGRFQAVYPADEFPGGEDFKLTLELQDFQLDPSLAGMKVKLPSEPFHFVVETIWCHTLNKQAGLEIVELELIPPTRDELE